ncbi:hypothetical protein PI125_g22346 [Phytophthora idaei]|nr:hypothetical protein PI125_g22346 [Phytophthora idaei]KAG3130245.1 hypothetical protein PI126_g20596 [Phytophthora idaei]
MGGRRHHIRQNPQRVAAGVKGVFIILRDRRLKQNAAKSCLFQLEALWCGKMISGSGIRHARRVWTL